jgi:hypothetical protein
MRIPHTRRARQRRALAVLIKSVFHVSCYRKALMVSNLGAASAAQPKAGFSRRVAANDIFAGFEPAFSNLLNIPDICG